MSDAESIVAEVTETYGLTYPAQVNLEAVANKMLSKMTKEEVLDCLDDVLDTVDRFWEDIVDREQEEL